MSKPDKYWSGKSGKKYGYWIHPIDSIRSGWSERYGNYMFANKPAKSNWSPIYIGETDNLRDHLSNHEKMPCLCFNGATHIHASRSSSSQEERRAEQADLIAKWNPPCNKK